MMEWEKPYMEAIIDNLKPRGHVLEIGFGLGYSASQIMKYPIESYTVIECDKNGVKAAKKWAKKQPYPVTVIEGFWQTEIHKLTKKFDTVFSDDAPRDEVQNDNPREPELFNALITRLANPGCRVSWYAGRAPWWIVHPATEYSCRVFKINIPQKCTYVPPKYKKVGAMFMPVISYPYGSLTTEEMDLYDIS
jgi:guanidinoacetate N-methyltransferase